MGKERDPSVRNLIGKSFSSYHLRIYSDPVATVGFLELDQECG